MLNSREVKDSIDDGAGLNALHVAAMSGQLISINMLLMRGFDIDSVGASLFYVLVYQHYLFTERGTR